MNQTGLRGGQCVPHKLVHVLARVVSRVLKVKGSPMVSIAFVSEKEIKALNKQYRKKNAVTDVLTFPLEGEEEIGEILVCYVQAKKQAQQYGTSIRTEVLLLITHGLLHVFGYHHKTAAEDQQMRVLSAKILKGVGHRSRL